jgi:ABC-2 type transport system permease protein
MQIKKLFLIALKDLRLIFRDPSALLLMLLAPFVLTLGLGAISGRFSGGTSSGISDIPVILVNDDDGELGASLISVFQSEELQDLVAPEEMEDLEAAKALVDEDQSAAVIHVPEGFTDSIIPSDESGLAGDVVQIEFYANPTRPTSSGVLRSILDQFVNQVEIGRISSEIIVGQLIREGLLSTEQISSVGMSIGREMAMAEDGTPLVEINNETAAESEETIQFDVLAYMAPGMAVMFLMFTVTDGGRTLLIEARNGTLSRLLVAPTHSGYVLGGKAFGIFLKGFAQLLILILGTSLLFNLEWGDDWGVLLLILTAAFAATGWGMLFAAILKTPSQIAVTGSAVMLLFGILGGSFFDMSMLPGWVSVLSKMTPNAWAIDGFYVLSIGGKLNNILPNVIALSVMGLALLSFASIWIRRHGLAKK